MGCAYKPSSSNPGKGLPAFFPQGIVGTERRIGRSVVVREDEESGYCILGRHVSNLLPGNCSFMCVMCVEGYVGIG